TSHYHTPSHSEHKLCTSFLLPLGMLLLPLELAEIPQTCSMHTSLSFGMLNQLHHLHQLYLQDNRTYPHIQTQPLHPTPTSLYPVELSESVSAYQCIWGTENLR